MAFSDKSGNGLTNLYSMISYCLNESECRRKLIAKHFDEVWQSHDCNQMCDVCTRPATYITKRNCCEEAVLIIDFLEQNRKQRFTPLKLVEQLAIKTMIKIDIQRLILKLIMEQYLKEDFHFTPYTTICYVIPGLKSSYVYNENCEIILDMIESTKKRSSNTSKHEEKQIIQKTSTILKISGTIKDFVFIFLIESSDYETEKINRFKLLFIHFKIEIFYQMILRKTNIIIVLLNFCIIE